MTMNLLNLLSIILLVSFVVLGVLLYRQEKKGRRKGNL